MCGYAYIPARILEHFECGMLELEECQREVRDRAVVRREIGLAYCIAQRLDDGSNPALEELLLPLQVQFVLGNEMAHDFAQCRDVILGLGALAAPRKAELRK